jgi:hypothetical protein
MIKYDNVSSISLKKITFDQSTDSSVVRADGLPQCFAGLM